LSNFILRTGELYNAAASNPAIPAIPAPNPSICPVGAAAPELAAAAVELVRDADVTEAEVPVLVKLLAPVAVVAALLEHTAAEGSVMPTGWQMFWANLMVPRFAVRG
jgi:hypothetical protein